MTKFNLQKFTPRHYAILDMFIAGATDSQVAEKFEMSLAQIRNIRRSPSFQHQFSIRRSNSETYQAECSQNEIDEAKLTLKRAAQKAAQRLVDGVDEAEPSIALKSANDILDRVGVPKQTNQRVEEARVQINISAEEAKVISDSLVMLKDQN